MTIEVEVEDAAWTDALPDCVVIVERAAEAGLALLSEGAPREAAAQTRSSPIGGSGRPRVRPWAGPRTGSADEGGSAAAGSPLGAGRSAPRLQPAAALPPQPLRDSSPNGGAPRHDAAAITLLLTDDASVRRLNADFRGKDAATNVLSFPAAESAWPHLGDIALAYGVCAREAEAQGKPLAHHLMHLTVHGVLHLLGYDHESDAEAEAMEGIERAVLSKLGVADPYAPPGDGVTEANA